jgi:hypothetical protein
MTVPLLKRKNLGKGNIQQNLKRDNIKILLNNILLLFYVNTYFNHNKNQFYPSNEL